MIKLEALIEYYERRVLAHTESYVKFELEVLVSTLAHLTSYSQAKQMLEKLAAAVPGERKRC